ncbi:MAG: polysaccharide deacetylase family protein [Treponemataceae bacterium]|nr:polysaccharide deacetylase family protein [Treponemataceae bacterium]
MNFPGLCCSCGRTIATDFVYCPWCGTNQKTTCLVPAGKKSVPNKTESNVEDVSVFPEGRLEKITRSLKALEDEFSVYAIRFKKQVFILAAALLLGLSAHNPATVSAQTTFSKLDLNSSNTLLFASNTKSTATADHTNLYMTELSPEDTVASVDQPKILTCYPEHIASMQGGKYLYVTNGNGTAIYNKKQHNLSWQTQTESLFSESNVPAGVSISPDGNWMVYLEKTSAAYANVMLSDLRQNRTLLLSTGAEYSYTQVPVLWAPDSGTLVYEKNNELYFLVPDDAFGASKNAEEFRRIGPGSISNVCWASSSLLVYVVHDLVYRISVNELFTRSLYGDLMGLGNVAGRLVNPFDSKRDRFWSNSDCSGIVMVQNSRTLLYLELTGSDVNYATTLFTYPFVNVAGSAINFQVFWSYNSAFQIPVVWVELLRNGSVESYVYKLTINEKQKNYYFMNLPLPPSVFNPIPSPDGKKLAFMDEYSVHVFNIDTWLQSAVFSKEKPISFSWIDKSSMYVGGQETVLTWNINANTYDVHFLSSAETFGWETETDSIIAKNTYGNFVYDRNSNVWNPSNLAIAKSSSVQNSNWRVFLGVSQNSCFTNGIFVRSISGNALTRPLLSEFQQQNPAKPKIALVFDAMDNADGLTPILKNLSKFNIKTTFFLNGEFMRRFPSAVQQIVSNGHECASMFNTAADLTTTTFILDENYIRRGLARNEDEFYSITGKELTLDWHAPYYSATNAIISAGNSAGYRYINPSAVFLDTTNLEETARTGAPYYSSAKVIEMLVKILHENAIIPVCAGLSLGTRTDYLYDHLDVLISAILDAGYEIVTVSKM